MTPTQLRSVSKLTSIVDSLPTAIIIVNGRGCVELVNEFASKLFGYAAGDLEGKPIEQLVPDRFRAAHPGFRALYVDAPTERPMGSGRDLTGLRQDGSEFPIEIGLNPITIDDEVFIVSAIVDITERVEHEAHLQRANEELERSNMELQRFAYIASHDLQNPMRNIASFVGLLQADYGEQLDETANEWMDRTINSVTQLQDLIGDLLTYARVETQQLPFETVSLQVAFDKAALMLESSIGESGACVTSDELPDVMGDSSQLMQLLMNLIGNALKYSGDEPPRVHVSAHKLRSDLAICVEDNGIGIDPQHRETVFEVFKRLHHQGEHPGTGIGLAICRRVVNRHGGSIWLESTPGRGSKFWFTLPGQAGSNFEAQDVPGRSLT